MNHEAIVSSSKNVCLSMDVCERSSSKGRACALISFHWVGTVAIRRHSHAIDALLLVCARAQISQWS